jgi:hypothetical protein
MRMIDVVLGCCAGLAVVAFGGCGNSDKGFTESTFRLTEDPKTQETLVIDVPPKTQTKGEFTPGDTVVVTKKYLSSRRPAGNAQLVCTTTFGGKDATVTCDGTLELRKGKLSINETFNLSSEEVHIAAVTGGTRAYAGATGTVFAGLGGGNVDEFHLLLP